MLRPITQEEVNRHLSKAWLMAFGTMFAFVVTYTNVLELVVLIVYATASVDEMLHSSNVLH